MMLLLELTLLNNCFRVAGFVTKSIHWISQETIWNKRSRRRTFLFAIGTFVIFRFNECRSYALIAKWTTAAGNHYSVGEKILTDAAYQILRNGLLFFRGHLGWLNNRIVIGVLVPFDERTWNPCRAFDLHRFFGLFWEFSYFITKVIHLKSLISYQWAERTIFNPMSWFVTPIALIINGNLTRLGRTSYLLIADETVQGKQINTND